jgi:lantibiotic modifying enzyme
LASDSFAWSSGENRLKPDFFNDILGIGYQLLRLRRPELLPSVLLWN